MKKISCDKHPKYKGNKKPKYQCVDCLSLYLLLKNKPRILPMPTKKFKDKSKYNRKKKYKKKEDKE